jgi:hypothetical protein
MRVRAALDDDWLAWWKLHSARSVCHGLASAGLVENFTLRFALRATWLIRSTVPWANSRVSRGARGLQTHHHRGAKDHGKQLGPVAAWWPCPGAQLPPTRAQPCGIVIVHVNSPPRSLPRGDDMMAAARTSNHCTLPILGASRRLHARVAGHSRAPASRRGIRVHWSLWLPQAALYPLEPFFWWVHMPRYPATHGTNRFGLSRAARGPAEAGQNTAVPQVVE